jgi:hypothetical protein
MPIPNLQDVISFMKTDRYFYLHIRDALSGRILHFSQLDHGTNLCAFFNSLLNVGILPSISLEIDEMLGTLTFTRIKTLCFYDGVSLAISFWIFRNTFSSPMVNLPWVSLFSSAKVMRPFTAASWVTLRANLAFPLVYSCPGYEVFSRVKMNQSLYQNSHRPWCHLVRKQVSHLRPCAYLPQFLQRNVRNLQNLADPRPILVLLLTSYEKSITAKECLI